MSTNLATLMVGLGYDLSALEKGAPEAFRLINSQTLGMSAEMKRASREGAESFRLIDEALGIHVSRPLTRILTQEFPGFAKALQSVIGVGIGGALVAVGVEAFDRVAEKIERAQKVEEAFQESTRKTGEVFTDAMQSFEKAEKLRSLTGLDKKLFDIDYSSVEQGRAKIDQLAAAMEKESAASIEAHKWMTELLAAIGNFAHLAFNSPGSLGLEQIGKQFTEFRQRFDELSKLDALHGTRESAKYLEDEIAKAKNDLIGMTAIKLTPLQGFEDQANRFMSQVGLAKDLKGSSLAVTQAEIDRQKQFIESLEKIQTLLSASTKDQAGREAEAKAAAAKEALDKEIAAIHAADAASEHWTETLIKAHAAAVPPKDQFAQFDELVRQAEIHYTALYHAIGEQAFYVRFHESLQQVIADMRELAGQKLTAPDVKLPQFIGTALPFQPPAAAPVVPSATGVGGTTAAQFETFSKDQAAQLKAAAAAYQDLVTPAEKYQLAQRELNLLLEKGLIDQAAYTAALQKASEALIQADDHIHKMQEDLQKLLERSTSATAGIQAFFLQLQIDAAENGKFSFQFLTEALHGFNDEVAKGIVTGKAHWREYFQSLDEMAIKFFLTKTESSLFHGLGGLFDHGSQTGQSQSGQQSGDFETGTVASPGGFGSLFSSLFGKSSVPSGAQSTTALFQQAVVQFQAAVTQFATAAGSGGSGLSSFFGSGGTGDGSGGGSADSLFPEIPGFASGTDSAPGGFAWVGEQGPELMNLPAGASVTPSAAVRGGGDQHYYDMRGAVVTEDLMRKADFARAMARARPGIIGEAVANMNEVNRRTPKR